MNDEIKITGGCLCEAVRYESSKPPIEGVYCHCRTCQRSLGNLFGVGVGFELAHFSFVSGEPTWYASSDLVRRGFCGSCGSPIAYQRNDVDFLVIWQGTLDHPEEFQPNCHVWTDSRISWVDIQAYLPDKTTETPSYKAATGNTEKDK